MHSSLFISLILICLGSVSGSTSMELFFKLLEGAFVETSKKTQQPSGCHTAWKRMLETDQGREEAFLQCFGHETNSNRMSFRMSSSFMSNWSDNPMKGVIEHFLHPYVPEERVDVILRQLGVPPNYQSLDHDQYIQSFLEHYDQYGTKPSYFIASSLVLGRETVDPKGFIDLLDLSLSQPVDKVPEIRASHAEILEVIRHSFLFHMPSFSDSRVDEIMSLLDEEVSVHIVKGWLQGLAFAESVFEGLRKADKLKQLCLIQEYHPKNCAFMSLKDNIFPHIDDISMALKVLNFYSIETRYSGFPILRRWNNDIAPPTTARFFEAMMQTDGVDLIQHSKMARDMAIVNNKGDPNLICQILKYLDPLTHEANCAKRKEEMVMMLGDCGNAEECSKKIKVFGQVPSQRTFSALVALAKGLNINVAIHSDFVESIWNALWAFGVGKDANYKPENPWDLEVIALCFKSPNLISNSCVSYLSEDSFRESVFCPYGVHQKQALDALNLSKDEIISMLGQLTQSSGLYESLCKVLDEYFRRQRLPKDFSKAKPIITTLARDVEYNPALGNKITKTLTEDRFNAVVSRDHLHFSSKLFDFAMGDEFLAPLYDKHGLIKVTLDQFFNLSDEEIGRFKAFYSAVEASKYGDERLLRFIFTYPMQFVKFDGFNESNSLIETVLGLCKGYSSPLDEQIDALSVLEHSESSEELFLETINYLLSLMREIDLSNNDRSVAQFSFIDHPLLPTKKTSNIRSQAKVCFKKFAAYIIESLTEACAQEWREFDPNNDDPMLKLGESCFSSTLDERAKLAQLLNVSDSNFKKSPRLGADWKKPSSPLFGMFWYILGDEAAAKKLYLQLLPSYHMDLEMRQKFNMKILQFISSENPNEMVALINKVGSRQDASFWNLVSSKFIDSTKYFPINSPQLVNIVLRNATNGCHSYRFPCRMLKGFIRTKDNLSKLKSKLFKVADGSTIMPIHFIHPTVALLEVLRSGSPDYWSRELNIHQKLAEEGKWLRLYYEFKMTLDQIRNYFVITVLKKRLESPSFCEESILKGQFPCNYNQELIVPYLADTYDDDIKMHERKALELAFQVYRNDKRTRCFILRGINPNIDFSECERRDEPNIFPDCETYEQCRDKYGAK